MFLLLSWVGVYREPSELAEVGAICGAVNIPLGSIQVSWWRWEQSVEQSTFLWAVFRCASFLYSSTSIAESEPPPFLAGSDPVGLWFQLLSVIQKYILTFLISKLDRKLTFFNIV